MPAQDALTKIPTPDRTVWLRRFEAFPHFRNFIRYAFSSLEPDIYADDAENPKLAAFYSQPAWFLDGVPQTEADAGRMDAFLGGLYNGSWILAAGPAWEERLRARFGTGLRSYPRQAFDSSGLDAERLHRLAAALPEGIRIVQAGPAELGEEGSPLRRSVVDEFFRQDDFLAAGLGFCLYAGERMVGFASSNYPIRDKTLEVFVRVADGPEYRGRGLGTAVAARLLLHCLERGIDPQWDAANDISTALALKLGYAKADSWTMYKLESGGQPRLYVGEPSQEEFGRYAEEASRYLGERFGAGAPGVPALPAAADCEGQLFRVAREDDGPAIGVCWLLADDGLPEDILRLAYLGIAPECRGKGYGRRLLFSQLKAMAAAGMRGVRSTVRSDDRVALGFLGSLGFTTLSREDGRTVLEHDLGPWRD